ncbi:MAG TPA: site-2 protease family protein [Xanthobacteraceae bacterium]|nr:site-2 protease family protein [Xanthobacteraceae bacterium]
MRWSLNIGTVAGTAVRIHITFLLFLVWLFAADYASGGPNEAWTGLIFMVALFACVLAHEFGHIFTARAFGVATPDVTLLPIGGVARLERIPEEPRQEFLIAIAGPAVNVVIALALRWLAGAHLDPNELASVDNAHISMIDRLAVVNLFLAVFNMIPAFPMDGGRVLRALLATRMGHTRATEIAAAVGQAAAFLLGFAGLFFNPLLIFIAVFVYLAASSEAHMVALKEMSHGVPVTNAMMTQLARLTPDAHVDEAVETLLRTSQSEFPVVDAVGKPVGLLARGDLIRAVRQVGPHARVAEVMNPKVPSVGYRRCLEDALRLLQEKSAPAVAVTDADGRLIGLVTSETIGEMMMLRESLPKDVTWGPWSRPTGA